jgi:hypothetical protein
MPTMTRMAPLAPTDFSPQTSLWQRGPHVELSACRWDCQVGTQPEQHAQDLLHSEPSGQRKPSRDPRGLVAKVPRSGVHDMPMLWPFRALIDTIKDTIEELGSIAAQRAISNKAAQLHPAPSSSREASPDVIIQDTEEGSKKRCKQCR